MLPIVLLHLRLCLMTTNAFVCSKPVSGAQSLPRGLGITSCMLHPPSWQVEQPKVSPDWYVANFTSLFTHRKLSLLFSLNISATYKASKDALIPMYCFSTLGSIRRIHQSPVSHVSTSPPSPFKAI